MAIIRNGSPRQSLSPDPRTPSEFEGSPTWHGRDAETEYVSETASYDHYDTNDGDEKKTGTYIWRTVGDSKVRSAHAERNGKTYSWDDPPEGGHPGEAPNCRCRAEDVKNSKECKELKNAIENAKLQIEDNRKDVKQARKNVLEGQREYVRLEEEFLTLVATLGLSDLAKRGGNTLSRLKKALGILGVVDRFHEIELAFYAMEDAKKDIVAYRKTLNNQQQILNDSIRQFLELTRNNDEMCRN